MKKIAFLGTGNMAAAIIRGMFAAKLPFAGSDLVLYNRTPAKYAAFADLSPVIAPDAAEAVRLADVVFLCVKPQNFSELLTPIRESGVTLDGKVFVSIAAGISTEAVGGMLGQNCAVVRCMPNTPLKIGMGVTAVCRNALVSDEDYELVCGIFSAAGIVMRLEESQMNTVICVNGSSPAYFYYFIDAMVKSAKAQGLECENLVEAVCRTVIGSAEMMLRADAEGTTPAELIRAVTSPKGTTERAMNVFAEADAAAVIDRAMRACTDRAEEMGKQFSAR